MDTSPGAVITISLVLAIVLSACPASGAFSFPADGMDVTGIIAGVPGPTDNGSVSGLHVIDESSRGKTVHAASGDMLLVKLKEYDPNRAWHFSSEDGFKVVSDVVLQSYPAQHDFKVRVLRPGDLRFQKIDSRDGSVIDTFTVHVAVDRKASGDDSGLAHPLSGCRYPFPAHERIAFLSMAGKKEQLILPASIQAR